MIKNAINLRKRHYVALYTTKSHKLFIVYLTYFIQIGPTNFLSLYLANKLCEGFMLRLRK